MAIDLTKIRDLLPAKDPIDPDIFYNRGLEDGFNNGYHAALSVIKTKATKKDAEKIQKLIVEALNEREDICRLHQEEKKRPNEGNIFLMKTHPYGIRFI